MQTRVEYLMEGQRLLRVMTQRVAAVQDVDQVEQEADLALINKRVQQRASELALGN